MERIRFITHQDHRVLLVDCSECRADEITTLATQLPTFIASEPKGSVLLLADFTRSQLGRETMERIKISAVLNRQHLKRSAWVLTDNLPKPLLDSVQKFSSREIPTFATREDALEYLVSR